MSLTHGSLRSEIFFRLMLIVLLALAAGVAGITHIGQFIPKPTIPQVPVVIQTAVAPQGSSGTASQNTNDLGSAIYQSASNPVSGKLPATAATVPNPIGSVYKNPFE